THELAVCVYHATKVLGPGPVDCAIDDDMPDSLGSELLGVGRKPKVGVDLPLREQLFSFLGWIGDEGNVFPWVHSDVSHHAGKVYVLRNPEPVDGNRLPSEIPDCADPIRPEHFKAAGMDAGKQADRIARVDPDNCRRCKVESDIEFAGGQFRLPVVLG